VAFWSRKAPSGSWDSTSATILSHTALVWAAGGAKHKSLTPLTILVNGKEVLLTSLATQALARKSHDGLPDRACITGFGRNHRCVQRSSANPLRPSRPKSASQSVQPAAVGNTGAGCGRAKLAGDREDAKKVAASLIHASVGEVWSVSVAVVSMFIVPYAEVSTIA
jgi:hypothetical protein